MRSKHFLFWLLVLHVASLQGKVVNEKLLQLSQLTKCTYDYEVTVYTARGAKSTLSDGYQVHALVRYSSFTLLTTNSRLLQAFSVLLNCQSSIYSCEFQKTSVENLEVFRRTSPDAFPDFKPGFTSNLQKSLIKVENF